MLKGKKILLGVTGSIAAYKVALLVRLLVKEGAEVRVVMTPAAAEFVGPLTFSTLSRGPVLSSLSDQGNWNNHVLLGRWADVMLIAPASANTLSKMANGACDNLLLAVYLSATCPVMIAPAMDEDMWHHPATRANLERLQSYGHILLPVERGELASGLQGDGRMAEPETILHRLQDHFGGGLPLQGETALVTAGPTYEPLDPVRFIGNHSSGKMGMALAEELARRGAKVELVLGPVQTQPPAHPSISVTKVQTAAEMHRVCLQFFKDVRVAVLAAAVADYRPAAPQERKIKKQEEQLTLTLEKTPDILAELGRLKRDGQRLIGFSLETNNEQEFALKKLKEKNLDMIVLNSLQDEGAGFMHDTNKVTIYTRSGHRQSYPLKSKPAVAADIVAAIIALNHE